ncbi:MAG: dockerin type I domain-containing protein [Planctomycetota bacterium]
MDRSGIVNWLDFAVFAAYWQRTDANQTNNWHKGADLDRNGEVNEIDLMLFAEQYLLDPNTIAKAIQFIPKEYRERLDETARQLLDYKGQTNQSIVCRVLQNNNTISEDMLDEITKGKYQKQEKPSLKQLLALSNNNEPSQRYETIEKKLQNNRFFATFQNGFA